MSRRILAVVGALLLALVGTGAVFAYVNRADARAVEGQKAVTVLMAAKEIPAGTTATRRGSCGPRRCRARRSPTTR
jgi:pilus assembly protein CpaB